MWNLNLSILVLRWISSIKGMRVVWDGACGNEIKDQGSWNKVQGEANIALVEGRLEREGLRGECSMLTSITSDFADNPGKLRHGSFWWQLQNLDFSNSIPIVLAFEQRN